MDDTTLCAHLSLLGWEAWVEDTNLGIRFNLTHPAYGTVWRSPGARDTHHLGGYRYGFEHAGAIASANARRVEITDIPPEIFRDMARVVSEVES